MFGVSCVVCVWCVVWGVSAACLGVVGLRCVVCVVRVWRVWRLLRVPWVLLLRRVLCWLRVLCVLCVVLVLPFLRVWRVPRVRCFFLGGLGLVVLLRGYMLSVLTLLVLGKNLLASHVEKKDYVKFLWSCCGMAQDDTLYGGTIPQDVE